ncbi:hypothetical protein AXK56_19305 [Tsukamurella pulmonis]|uniref:ABC-2 family transporter protein n=1 Tax=Tsukamurella pulmonis TaxID=47312 RepID=A0A1H1HFF8_9ACTN|nr:ABC transporter permease [Tsukamurella pulmonis]KXO94763.1 hypothetical protein AXK56_19305 [Tsukamurella pulmonis]SDR24145.1 ABC-2 family transporter protein [Tsukamurella pulmonis]SUP14865.1 ABC-2 family transporter protein [Tsukamurella pulmonis]
MNLGAAARATRAELLKLASLPAVWAGSVLALVVAPVVTYISAPSSSSPNRDLGYQELAFGVVGAIVVGVVAVSSEYSSEGDNGDTSQISTTLAAQPNRYAVFVAKGIAVAVLVALLAVVSSLVTLTVASTVSPAFEGGAPGRVLGVVVYWILMAELACVITWITRNGVLPLIVLVLNTSVVTVTYLLSRIVAAGSFFPDMAGMRMFLRDVDSKVALSPAAGGAVMAAWVVVIGVVAVSVFARRDA